MRQGKKLLDDLETVQRVSHVYGVKKIMNEAEKYENMVLNSLNRDDHFSACKLADRFLFTAACVLIYYLARDIRDIRLQGERDYGSLIDNLKQIASWL